MITLTQFDKDLLAAALARASLAYTEDAERCAMKSLTQTAALFSERAKRIATLAHDLWPQIEVKP